MSAEDGILSTISEGIDGLASNPIATAIGGAIAGSALTGAIISGTSKAKRKTRKTSKKRSSKTRRRAKGKRFTPHTAGKRKDTSRRRIRQTKTGQPYIILASGKARFISKASARASRRRKGGRY